MFYAPQDTIVALSTPVGSGAIGVIRLSGDNAVKIADSIFVGKNLDKQDSHSLHFGRIIDRKEIIDEVVIGLFKAPRSYTKEDVVEISCHGSSYIIERIINLCIRQGARLAKRGEFTMRAFLNGQMDLSQAEAVGDLIASESSAAHAMAMNQLRGGIGNEIKKLRKDLIKFASLIELENDFSEEDVEFANREELVQTIDYLQKIISNLLNSFEYGNAVKKGISVVIVGRPNVGKSTLLNVLLNEEKAIVSNIAGTTRDVIEDTLIIDGIRFRFLDTAGLRNTTDIVEALGIGKTKEAIQKAQIIIYLDEIAVDYKKIIENYKEINSSEGQKSIILLNKSDEFHACHQYDIEEAISTLLHRIPVMAISAKENIGIDKLKNLLVKIIKNNINPDQTILSNVRHYEAFLKTQKSLQAVREGLSSNVPSDLVAIDIRHALHHLGEIAGEISNEDLLDSIFRDFCIGK